MRTNEQYLAPKSEEVSVELRGILNASEPERDFSGEVMDFTRDQGEW